MFPVITVTGGPYERGRQYGVAARDRVHRSIAAYERTFRHYADWDWSRSTAEAKLFVPAIDDFAPQYLEEMAGLADGAGVTLDDVLAINVRTEVMYSARVRSAVGASAPAECSAFASVAPGRVLAGQNWDWAPFACDTVVVLECVPSDGPAFLTVVEAGLLAKFGVNSEGLAVMTNALACTDDNGEAAVPYHVMLRGLLDCSTTGEALALLEQTTRASSANYLLADSSGAVVDVEAQPGGQSALHPLLRDDSGVLLHTNHFVSPEFDAVDYADLVISSTRTRLHRVTELVESADDVGDLAVFEEALADHACEPDSVCRHPDLSLPPPEQSMTVASVVVDLTERRIRLCEGPPCTTGFEDMDSSWLW
ncbi:MAG: isopenicillin-N N-acyltransferase like protein [Nocardioidaceae bacterium]|jgi:isopenicillin-N N-acyltransferase-like protein|nr:isopenicillin-N N-acyltransferase like protein [Nocardioidaceae bacterium]